MHQPFVTTVTPTPREGQELLLFLMQNPAISPTLQGDQSEPFGKTSAVYYVFNCTAVFAFKTDLQHCGNNAQVKSWHICPAIPRPVPGVRGGVVKNDWCIIIYRIRAVACQQSLTATGLVMCMCLNSKRVGVGLGRVGWDGVK